MPRGLATFAWTPAENAQQYEIFYGSSLLVTITGETHSQELDLDYGQHEFSIRGIRDGEAPGPLQSAYVTVQRPVEPMPVGPVGDFSVSFSIFGVGNTPPTDGPYDISGLVNNSFTVTWPTDPTITRTVTVSTFSEFQTEIQVSGTHIRMNPGTYAGNIFEFTANDIWVEAITPGTVRWNGYGNIAGVQRWKFSGLDINTGSNYMEHRDITDLTYENCAIYGALFMLGNGACERVAFINFTLEGDPIPAGQDFGFYMAPISPRYADITFANVRNDAVAGNAVNRFQTIDRFTIYQSCLGMDGGNPVNNGLRLGKECATGHVQDTVIGGGIFASLVESGQQDFADYWFENVTRYARTETNQWHSSWFENTPNTGTVNNCQWYDDDAGELGNALGLNQMSAGPSGNPTLLTYGALPDLISSGNALPGHNTGTYGCGRSAA